MVRRRLFAWPGDKPRPETAPGHPERFWQAGGVRFGPKTHYLNPMIAYVPGGLGVNGVVYLWDGGGTLARAQGGHHHWYPNPRSVNANLWYEDGGDWNISRAIKIELSDWPHLMELNKFYPHTDVTNVNRMGGGTRAIFSGEYLNQM